MGQIFVNNIGYTHFIPMEAKSEAGYALQEFIQDVGIPCTLHTDGAKVLTEGKWRDVCKTFGIKQTFTEPHSPFQNRAEINIRELKKQTRRIMQQSQCPLPLWDLCASYVAEIRNLTAQPLYSLHGRTPFELVTGNTPDISEYIAFKWYQPVWYHDNSTFPEPTRHIARWIGVAHKVGQAMCFWILPSSGVPIARTTLQAIDEAELPSPVVQDLLKAYDREIEIKIGDQRISETLLPFDFGSTELDKTLPNSELPDTYKPIEPEYDKPDIDDYDEETYDRFMSAEVLLPKGDYQYVARVLGRKRDNEGRPIGHYNKNPILDTTIHEVEFPDGTIHEYAANTLAEALYSQVDPDGNRWLLLKDIIGHDKDASAPTREDLSGGIRLRGGNYTVFGLMEVPPGNLFETLRSPIH